MPDFSTVNESGHCKGSVSVGPGMVEAFVVGTAVGTVVGFVVWTVVGAGVGAGGSGVRQPAAVRSSATARRRETMVRYCMIAVIAREYLRLPHKEPPVKRYWTIKPDAQYPFAIRFFPVPANRSLSRDYRLFLH